MIIIGNDLDGIVVLKTQLARIWVLWAFFCIEAPFFFPKKSYILSQYKYTTNIPEPA